MTKKSLQIRFSLLGTVFMLLSMTNVAAQTIVASGNCGANAGGGKNLTWVLTKVGNDTILTVSGSGDMAAYNSVDAIPWYSHSNRIRTIVINDGVASIGYGAFANCSRLTSVTISRTVANIGDYAFSNCSSLGSLTSKKVFPAALGGNNVFNNVSTAIPVYIPCQSLSRYNTTAVWKNFTNFKESLTDTTFYTVVKCKEASYSDENFTNLAQEGTYYRTHTVFSGCDSVMCLTLVDIVTPYDVTVTLNSYYFIIRWNGNAASHQIYRNGVLFAVDSTKEFIDRYITSGETYCYKINGKEGDCESEFSEEICRLCDVGIVSATLNNQIRVYPNPTTGKLTINNEQLTIENIEIYDVVGRLYTPLTPLKGGTKSPFEGGRGMSEKAPSLSERAGGEVTIDISHLANGMYFLKITTEDGSWQMRKFVKN